MYAYNSTTPLNLPVPVYERPEGTWSKNDTEMPPPVFPPTQVPNGMVAIGLEEKTGRLVRLVKGTDALFHVP
ncbi:MAG: hypothetical protein Ct9H300mP7_2970 [Verrucomicrobiota bacterium]|nr:MAG: hypothetical protein Ct9H300mP7_2970 [Verrucomicrobiota bacterium]